MAEALEVGFLLDRQWHWLRGEMERSKEPDLAALIRVLSEQGVAYAVIGGVALQIHQKEPRTTLDIDVAVKDRARIPREELAAAGFRETGRFGHTDNWVGPDGTPVQFTDDPALLGPIERAAIVLTGGLTLHVLRPADLLHEKLRSGRDPARRRSKRLQDLADAQSLIEQDPSLAEGLSADERAQLDKLPR